MKKVKAVYMRVSSVKQDIASQEPDLKRWAAAQDGEVVWFTEKVSGRAKQRPQWEKLYQLIRSRKISELVVWRIDRLGRSTSQLTKLFDELQEYQVNLVSLRDGIDLSTSVGRMIANVLASMAQFETELRQERINAGIEAAKASGKKWGGRKKGIRLKVKENHIIAAKQLKSGGMPVNEIAETLKLSRGSIYSILQSQ